VPSFELFVAGRYLRAKRKEKFISVVTVISGLGVMTGVTALVVALAVNNGIQQDLQAHLLSATSHVNLLEKERGFGIEDWHPLLERLSKIEHVAAAAPALYGEVMISGPIRGRGAVLKGVDLEKEGAVTGIDAKMVEGAFEDLDDSGKRPGILLGKDLAMSVGAKLHSLVTVTNPQGEMTPFGMLPGSKHFRVAGIFDTGFFQYDSSWAFSTLKAAQQALSLGDVINAIEFKLDDLNRAGQVAARIEEVAGEQYVASSWMERNRTLFNALKVEKLVTAITIGLIMLVAALNILSSLVMMVMEKNKDIAILMAMGARRRQIRRIFRLQGLIIGAIGTAAGLVVGHLLCWVCDAYRLIPLEPEVYGISYVPFRPELWDAVWVAGAAMLISYLTTIYPSGSATRVAPVEVLRYE